MTHQDPDGRIHEIAARQHGVLTRAQLLEAGVSPGAIRHRLKKGLLRPMHRGVYRTGPIAARLQAEMAAVLAAGPGAVLSNRTAAGLWGILPARQPEAPVDILGPRSLRGPASGVRLYRRRRAAEADEITQRHGLPLTAPARTILDLAAELGPDALERALARALKRDPVAPEAIEALLRRYPRRPGGPLLRSLLHAANGPALTRSEAEGRVLKLLRRAGVPRPRTNAVVKGLEVDFLWPDRNVVVEVDGFAFHAHRSAFENDRRRDSILAAEGFTVVRVTWRQVTTEPERVLARLCMTLGARGQDRTAADVWQRPA